MDPPSDDAKQRTVRPFYTLKLGDLIRPAAGLVVTCMACHRVADLAVVPLALALGANTRLRGLEDRMRCAGCGQRGWASIRLEWLG